MTDFFGPTRRGFLAGGIALLTVRPASAQGPIVLRAAEAELPFGDAVLETPAFDDAPVGPVLELRRAEEFALRFENALDIPLRFRAQGLRGKRVKGADTPVAPGETREIVLTPPDAGTFLYACTSDDRDETARCLLLSGPLIVMADQPAVADREVVLAVNTLVTSSETDAPARVLLVNGEPSLNFAAQPGERLRLRIVNLAQETLAGLKLPSTANVVSLDGQPCDPFAPVDGAGILPPLGRADVLLDVPTDDTEDLVIADFFAEQDLVKIAVRGEPMGERFLAEKLPDNLGLPKEIPLGSAARMTWKPGAAPPDPLLSVKTGASVVLSFENGTTPHALVLEGLAARHLDALDDGWKPWWHDTILVSPEETVRLAFIAKEPGRYAVDLVPLGSLLPGDNESAPVRGFIEVVG